MTRLLMLALLVLFSQSVWGDEITSDCSPVDFLISLDSDAWEIGLTRKQVRTIVIRQLQRTRVLVAVISIWKAERWNGGYYIQLAFLPWVKSLPWIETEIGEVKVESEGFFDLMKMWKSQFVLVPSEDKEDILQAIDRLTEKFVNEYHLLPSVDLYGCYYH